jgi:hypothetical protein
MTRPSPEQAPDRSSLSHLPELRLDDSLARLEPGLLKKALQSGDSTVRLAQQANKTPAKITRTIKVGSAPGDQPSIVTTDEHGTTLYHYVKKGDKWFIKYDGGEQELNKGIRISEPDKDGRRSVSFETDHGIWRTEKPDGTTVYERSNPDGSLVALKHKDAQQADKITRKDGSSVEVNERDNAGGITKFTETGRTGKTVWEKAPGNDQFTSRTSAETRQKPELSLDGSFSYDSAGFRHTITGAGETSRYTDDLGLMIKRDTEGRIKEITYPPGSDIKKLRVLSRDKDGKADSIEVHHQDGKYTFVKEGNRCFLKILGMRSDANGTFDVSGRGDLSLEVKPGVWNTYKPNGESVEERSNDSGARIELKDGKVRKITRKDGSVIEAQYDSNGGLHQATEYSPDGAKKDIWVKRGDHFESVREPKELRKNIELLPSGITTFQSADGVRHITLGDGTKLVEGPGRAKFDFDQQGRFKSISYTDGDRLEFTYMSGTSNKLKEISKFHDGKLIKKQTRIDDSDTLQIKGPADKLIGTWTGELKITTSGELRFKATKSASHAGDDMWTVVKPDGSQYKEKVDPNGSRVIKKLDKSTVEIDSEGFVRKVSISKTDYRTLDYENGRLSKVTDHRKGKETVLSIPDGDRDNYKVSETGDLTRRTPDGRAVIERSNLSKIELDAQGYITKVTAADGSTRSFEYKVVGEKKEPISITDTRFDDKGQPRAETWKRNINSDFSLSNMFSSTTNDADGKPRVRNDIVIGQDGEYQYRGTDNKLHIAKVGKTSGDGSLSASVDEARDNFMDALAGQINEKRTTRMREFMKEYEKRMMDRVEAQVAGGMNEEKAREAAEKVVAGTYDQLTGLVAPTDAQASGQYFNQVQRVQLAENFMFLAQNPLESNQGSHGTCWIHSGWISGGLVGHCDDLGRLLKEVALTGKYTTKQGDLYNNPQKTVSFSRQLFSERRMGGMGEEAHWTIDRAHVEAMVPGAHQTYAGARSPVGMIFDQVLPVLGGRREGQSTGGNFASDPNSWYGMNGRRVLDGSQNILYMVTGHKIEIESESNPDAQRQRQILLEKGAICDSPPGHLRCRQLIKKDGSWYVVQDDQHGNRGDHVMYKIKDLKTWLKEKPERNLVVHRDFDLVGDKTIGGDQPTPDRPPRPRPTYVQVPNPYGNWNYPRMFIPEGAWNYPHGPIHNGYWNYSDIVTPHGHFRRRKCYQTSNPFRYYRQNRHYETSPQYAHTISE